MRKRVNGLSFRKQKKKINIPLLKEIFVWMLQIMITIAIAFVFVYFVGMQTAVVGASMEGQLADGNRVLVNRFIYRVFDPNVGDIVVFQPNGNKKSHYYIKRVIGTPGDMVQIEKGIIYVNGKAYENTNFKTAIDDAGVAAEPVLLGEDEYFVLGDNPLSSEDSRFAHIGNVKKEYMIGKAWLKVYPMKEAAFLK